MLARVNLPGKVHAEDARMRLRPSNMGSSSSSPCRQKKKAPCGAIFLAEREGLIRRPMAANPSSGRWLTSFAARPHWRRRRCVSRTGVLIQLPLPPKKRPLTGPFFWRRGRDSNPRSPRGDNAFRVRPVRPLRHLSAGRGFYTPEADFARIAGKSVACRNRSASDLS